MSSCNPPSPTLFSPFTDEESRKRKIEYITNEIAKRRIIEEENYKLKHDLEVLRELNTALQQQLARLGTEKIQSLTVSQSKPPELVIHRYVPEAGSSQLPVPPPSSDSARSEYYKSQLGIDISNDAVKICRSLSLAAQLYKSNSLKRSDKHIILSVFSPFSNRELQYIFSCGAATLSRVRSKLAQRLRKESGAGEDPESQESSDQRKEEAEMEAEGEQEQPQEGGPPQSGPVESPVASALDLLGSSEENTDVVGGLLNFEREGLHGSVR